MKPAPLTMLLIASAGPALLAHAQATNEEDRFRPIEEGFDDVSPHAASNRLQQVDTRVPMDFTRVYEIVGSPGLLARRSGAVTAVFPRSIYNVDASAPIPPGTVFYVGELPLDLAQPGIFSPGIAAGPRPGQAWSRLEGSVPMRASPPMAGERIDLRVPLRPAGAPAAVEPARESESLWGSESYRQQRVGDILRGVVWRARRAEAMFEPSRAAEVSETQTGADAVESPKPDDVAGPGGRGS